MQPSTNRSFRLRLNLFTLRLTRNWLKIALVIIGLYALLPYAAPTLMRLGVEGPARFIYTLYTPFCHQFAFRSLFLFGDQVAYPRAISRSELADYEDYFLNSPNFTEAAQWGIREVQRFGGRPLAATPQELDPYLWTVEMQFASRYFAGDNQMGYKTALCARDVAIYNAIFFSGLLYAIPFVRRRLRPIPILLFIFLGIGPIGIDGFSQLLGYAPFNFWPPRETTPFFRVLTGALFGFCCAWLGFPYLEASMRDTRDQLTAKLVRAGIQV